jgi:hypothetical protein
MHMNITEANEKAILGETAQILLLSENSLLTVMQTLDELVAGWNRQPLTAPLARIS